MKREIADIQSTKVQASIRELQWLESHVAWAGVVTLLGGLAASFWLLYRVFHAKGFWMSLLAFAGLSLLCKFGFSPTFAVASSFLCFHFHAVGIWLPLSSYVLAAVLLYVDFKRANLWRRIDPFHLGSIHDELPDL